MGRLAGWILRWWGWTLVGERPAAPRYVVVAAPHSPNWDAVLMLLCAFHFGIRVRFLGKKESFRWPLGPLLRRLGGIPIDRSGGLGLVEESVAALRAHDAMALALAPDGTRAYRDYWKSGFYHIALGADVPVVLSFMDWGTRRAGVGPTLRLSGDVRVDMETIRAFYAGMRGRRADQTSRVRLLEEDQAP